MNNTMWKIGRLALWFVPGVKTSRERHTTQENEIELATIEDANKKKPFERKKRELKAAGFFLNDRLEWVRPNLSFCKLTCVFTILILLTLFVGFTPLVSLILNEFGCDVNEVAWFLPKIPK